MQTLAPVFAVALVAAACGDHTPAERGRRATPEAAPPDTATPIESPNPGPRTPVTAEVAARVHVGAHPGSVAAADGSVWVATSDAERDRDAVVRIDAATNEVVAATPVDGIVSHIAVGEGAVWVASSGTRSALLRIDASTDQVGGRVEGVRGPVVVGSTGVWAIEEGEGGDAAVVRIDPRALRVETRIPAGDAPLDMAAGAGSVWVLRHTPGGNARAGDLVRIDASSGETTDLPIMAAGRWIAAEDRGVWMGAWNPHDPNDANAYLVDASSNDLSPQAGDVFNFRPFAVAAGRVWFISGPHDRGLPRGGVCGLNVETRSVDVCADPGSVPDLELAHDPGAFEPVTGSIWLGAFDEPRVTRIDVVAHR